MTFPLQQIIYKHIQNSPAQRISFAEYMNLVLYSPQHGYYASGAVQIGSEGDFFTSSSLAADFGELLAEQFIEIWQILNCPSPFHLVEMGAGQGLLAADILKYIETKNPDFINDLEYIIIEEAEGLIARQQKVLNPWLEKGIKIQWKSWDEIEDNSLLGCCFSNELVDAFPVHSVIVQEGKLQEVYVALKHDELVEVVAELSTPQLAEYFFNQGIDLLSGNYGEGYRTEVNLAALDWLTTVASKMQQGYLITIDYGYSAQRYYNPQRREGTLQCYYQHRRHNNPYAYLGQQDLTAHVNFTALEMQGERCGLEKLDFTQQGMFLMALGLGDRLTDLSSGKYSFQEVLNRRDALHQLIDPAGLGGYGVLVQTKGLSENQKARSLKGLKIPTLQ